MSDDPQPKIYWANALFSEAERDFNAKCAKLLRNTGHQVFLPQEAGVNILSQQSSPLAEDIFRVDTAEILDSHLLIASIDQETIDCGVACEIGIAFSYGIPIIGLYTDIRQQRQGPTRMYKNQYVVGAIEAIGEVVTNTDDLLRVIPRYLSRARTTHSALGPEDLVPQHFTSIAPRYSDFVTRLESWYAPHWNGKQVVDKWLQSFAPRRIVEFGCGIGELGVHIFHQYPDVFYLGYDKSPVMIQLASKRLTGSNCIFTASWAEVEDQASKIPFDVALSFFALHDLDNPHETISLLAECLRAGGLILIADLSTLDLPKLTDLLRRNLARPLCSFDSRMDPVRLNEFAQGTGSEIIDCSLTMPLVRFPSARDVDEYLEVFGIYAGMDLPLGLRGNASKYRELTRQILEDQSYPFVDQRAFVICVLRKQ
jgi:nucleoside 2-deoxyribosyltransferase/ubiquinone/menaquinone biosynthesis C-methylase UbiE